MTELELELQDINEFKKNPEKFQKHLLLLELKSSEIPSHPKIFCGVLEEILKVKDKIMVDFTHFYNIPQKLIYKISLGGYSFLENSQRELKKIVSECEKADNISGTYSIKKFDQIHIIGKKKS